MKRTVSSALNAWKERPDRLPLILRGARQVGKTYLVQEFAKTSYSSFAEINFEIAPEANSFFSSLDPQHIVSKLETLTNQRIIPGQTLLFFDEIQNCPEAIVALRYFKEKMPELHVIAAGSLLEFTLQDTRYSFPVGRVEFLTVRPLSFIEFLEALNLGQMIEAIKKTTLSQPVDGVFHQRLLGLMREYLIIGGMPAVVNNFVASKSYIEARRMQANLLLTYQLDFAKYATKAQHKHLQRFFARAPALVGQDFKYVHVDAEAKSRDLRVALDQLCWAGLLAKVHVSNASGPPLAAQIKENFFKLLFLDVGLVQCTKNTDIQMVLEKTITQIDAGSIAEQLVGQELLAYSDNVLDESLYYWRRDKKGSEAQVDYLVGIGPQIIPVEVKAGKTGRLKSLQLFLQEQGGVFGIKISESPLAFEHNVLSIPFYLISEISRLGSFSFPDSSEPVLA